MKHKCKYISTSQLKCYGRLRQVQFPLGFSINIVNLNKPQIGYSRYKPMQNLLSVGTK